ncbi:MAG: choice-of-anchor D domain-containing protein [Chitinophagales bacterium]|nr:choice-of-anchor D domain-containing protein [Chitinophagaceae bacterium]MCB9065369.1 choice-of-anchor D domain-containing protein [Chitinophagales bacterium]
MKKILSLITLLLLTIASYAHVWEIRVNQAQNGTLTWYLQSYHTVGQCGIANSGLTINGVNYPLQSEHSGSIAGLSNTVFAVTSSPSSRASYAIVQTPFLGTTLSVQPYSTNACWAFMVGGSGNFTPPPPPVCTSCPITSWTNTTGSPDISGTPCNPNDDLLPTTITVNHLSCASITSGGQFTVVYDPSGANVSYGPYNFSTGISTNVNINLPVGVSNSTQLSVNSAFPCAVTHGLSIPGGSFNGVIENVPPNIAAPSNVTVNVPVGGSPATGVSLGSASASDNCGIASVTNNAPSSFPAGNTTVTWTATDVNGNTATANQTVTVNEPATALNFDGGNDKVIVPHSGSLNVSAGGELTMEAWVYPTTGGWRNIAMKGSYGYGMILSPANQIAFWDQGSGAATPKSTSTVPINQWSHIALTVKDLGSTLEVRYYINGTPAGVSISSQSSIHDNTGNLIIGEQGTSCICNRFVGSMDELRIWSRALCQGEIMNNMNCGLNPAGQSGLVALYHFDQGFVNANNSTVTTVIDASGNGNNGATFGFALNGATSNWASGTVSGTCGAFVLHTASISAASSTTICSGSSVVLNANTGAGYSYQWYLNGSAITNATNASYTASAAGNYTVDVTLNGCTATSSAVAVNISENNGLHFDGTNDFVSVPYTTLSSGLTYAAWIKTTSAANTAAYAGNPALTIVGDHTNSITKTFGITGGKVQYHSATSGSTWADVTGSSSVNDGNWHHVAVSHSTSGAITLYVDGVVDGTGSLPFNAAGSGTPAFDRIGGSYLNASGTGALFNGTMDEVYIFSGTRTQAQIQASMSGLGGNESGLLAYYNANTGTAQGNNTGLTTLADASTPARNGTLNNFALVGCTSNWVVGAPALGNCSSVPEINVKGNSLTINDGDNTPDGSDHTDFGSALPGNSIARTFTIENTGTASLNVSAINITGANASSFTVSGISLPLAIAQGTSTTFIVTFADVVVGVQTVTVNISSTDCDESIYDYAVQAEVLCVPAAFTSMPANATASTDAGLCSTTSSYSASVSGNPTPTVSYVFTGATTGSGNGTGSGSTFNVGTTTVTITAVNPCSNIDSSFTITVNDNEKPTIVCPADVSVKADEGECSATNVSLGTPTTGDNCGVATTVNNAPSSYPVGTTTVTWTVTDIHGNTATCTQDVVVTDNQAPAALCKAYTLNLSGGTGTVNPSDVDNGSSDNCGIASMSVYPNTFTCADAGNNTVVLTVNDIHGNSSTCTTSVLVQYQPTCSITTTPSNNTYTGGNPNNIFLGYGPQSATITANATGGTGFTYSWSPATDLSCTNCQSPVFTPSAAGTYTYTVTVTNANGCSTTCTVSFCVLDIRVPGNKGKSSGKVYLCHVPPGNNSNPQTLSVSVNAVASHLSNHSGDRLGQCDQSCNSAAKGGRNAGEDNGIASLEELNDKAAEMKVYPNPNTGSFTIELPGEGAAKVVVTTISGQVVHNFVTSSEQKLDVNLSDVASGMYMIHITQGGEVYHTKVSIQK